MQVKLVLHFILSIQNRTMVSTFLTLVMGSDTEIYQSLCVCIFKFYNVKKVKGHLI